MSKKSEIRKQVILTYLEDNMNTQFSVEDLQKNLGVQSDSKWYLNANNCSVGFGKQSILNTIHELQNDNNNIQTVYGNYYLGPAANDVFEENTNKDTCFLASLNLKKLNSRNTKDITKLYKHLVSIELLSKGSLSITDWIPQIPGESLTNDNQVLLKTRRDIIDELLSSGYITHIGHNYNCSGNFRIFTWPDNKDLPFNVLTNPALALQKSELIKILPITVNYFIHSNNLSYGTEDARTNLFDSKKKIEKILKIIYLNNSKKAHPISIWVNDKNGPKNYGFFFLLAVYYKVETDQVLLFGRNNISRRPTYKLLDLEKIILDNPDFPINISQNEQAFYNRSIDAFEEFETIKNKMFSLSENEAPMKVCVEIKKNEIMQYSEESLRTREAEFITLSQMRKESNLYENDYGNLVYEDTIIGMGNLLKFLRKHGASVHVVGNDKIIQELRNSAQKVIANYRKYGEIE